MPNTFSSGPFLFRLSSVENGIYYYTIIHSSGRYWDYHHAFSSTYEMDEYAQKQSS